MFALVLVGPSVSAVSIITLPDIGSVGRFTSITLDSNGYPVVSYYDHANGALKVLHCNDPHCAGGDESITSPDMIGVLDLLTTDAFFRTSVLLDLAGNPVVSYYDATNDDLKVLHCNDPNCAGGDESITNPDATGDVGVWASLALDGAGNPVVSYYDATNDDLKLLHCNDPDCAGGDESITSPDTAGDTGGHTSVVIDPSSNPVVAYVNFSGQELRILHCNDPDCAGGDESITSPDTTGSNGGYTSVVLDSTAHPVISYRKGSGPSGDLEVLHCNDPDCAGGDESITSPDPETGTGFYTSLELDSTGNPVISHWDGGDDHLKVVQCNDPQCAGDDETISEPDPVQGGLYTSLALDSDDDPVVSYFREAGALVVLGCTMAECVEGGGISGHVTVLGEAVAGVEVFVELDSGGPLSSETTTNASGFYQIGDLPQGDYIVRFDLDGYIDEWYDDKHTVGEADLVAVSLGEIESGINANLTEGGTISGHVGDSRTDLAGRHIELYDLAGSKLPAAGVTGGDGVYTIDFLIPGPYKVRLVEGDVWYQDKNSHGKANVVTVLDTVETSGIDFFVDATAPVWGAMSELRVTTYGETTLDLTWTAASDNVAVTGYLLRLSDMVVAEPSSSRAILTGLQPGTAYLVEVLAEDAAGNLSPPLSAVLRTARSFSDVAGHLFYGDILWLSGNEITRGCNPPVNDRFCPDDFVTRGQMAAFLVRAFGYSDNGGGDLFVDDDASTFEADIDRLGTAGVTRGCNPPVNDRFCPDDFVTRGQMAAFLHRAFN